MHPTILAVDHSLESLRFLTATLASADMTALAATDGLAALDVLGHATPDLIVMDVMMPGLDGFETAGRITANPNWRHIPIIFMTGGSRADDVLRGLDVGAADFIAKPVVIDELLARIRMRLAAACAARDSQLALDTSGRPVLSVDATGNLHWMTPGASRIVRRLYPDWDPASGDLPQPLRFTIARMLGIAPSAGTCASDKTDQATLETTFLGQASADRWLFRLTERQHGREERILADRLNLSSREAEVLLWISRGKQNSEVGEILGISPRTVNKHLEHIFKKMGLENRAAATAIAVATLER